AAAPGVDRYRCRHSYSNLHSIISRSRVSPASVTGARAARAPAALDTVRSRRSAKPWARNSRSRVRLGCPQWAAPARQPIGAAAELAFGRADAVATGAAVRVHGDSVARRGARLVIRIRAAD